MADNKDPEIADAYALFGDEPGVPRKSPDRPDVAEVEIHIPARHLRPRRRADRGRDRDRRAARADPDSDEAGQAREDRGRRPRVQEAEGGAFRRRGLVPGRRVGLDIGPAGGRRFRVVVPGLHDVQRRSPLAVVPHLHRRPAPIWVALTYPIVVTLERPVRMTPEQALKDYFAAASHHFPHYRRMWLLLSATGRSAAEFDSFPAFRDYWKSRMKQLRGDRVKPMTPLVFRVEEFKSDKSAGGGEFVEGQSTRVEVSARGSESSSPIDSVRFDTSLVRGPDKMWYLNEGRLPSSRD